LELEKYHHGNLKAELIEKGLKLLDEEGYDGFSLRKVAKACNVSQTAPYRHFKNKDELIFAIGNETMNKFSQSLQQAVDKYPDDPASQLKEMGYSYIRFFIENPEYLRLIFLSDIDKRIGTNCNNSDEYKMFLDNGEHAHPFQILYKAVERYKKEVHNNITDSMDQNALLLYCWGLVHGISIIITRREFSYQGDYLDLVKSIFWNDAFLG
jgi:AcrR family transcriptional regulator